jgi:hypothetical protein
MSLFGHMALKFGSHPENLATQALGTPDAGNLAARASPSHKYVAISSRRVGRTPWRRPSLSKTSW